MARRVLIDEHQYWSSINGGLVINKYESGGNYRRD
jgi:hypothetical protein